MISLWLVDELGLSAPVSGPQVWPLPNDMPQFSRRMVSVAAEDSSGIIAGDSKNAQRALGWMS